MQLLTGKSLSVLSLGISAADSTDNISTGSRSRTTFATEHSAHSLLSRVIYSKERHMTSIGRIAFTMAVLSAAAGGGCMTGEPESEAGDRTADQTGDEQTGEVASELASDCEFGANGFIDIPDNLSGTIRRSRSLGAGVLLTLESGPVAGAQRGWAKISGATIPGDQVLMDWTIDAGASVKVRCGPFTVGSNGMSKTSAAKVTNPSPSYQFRACGRLAGAATFTCTTPQWW
jgi:hypothetical protein